MGSFHRCSASLKIVCVLLILAFSTAVIAPPMLSAQAGQQNGLDICAKAKVDRSADGGGGGYFFAGLFCGLIGFIIAAVSGGNPPAERLVGMDASEANLYVSCYKSDKRHSQMKYAGIGWGIGVAAVVAILLSGSSSN